MARPAKAADPLGGSGSPGIWQKVDGMAVQQDALSTAGAAESGTHEVAVEVSTGGARAFCRLRVELEE